MGKWMGARGNISTASSCQGSGGGSSMRWVQQAVLVELLCCAGRSAGALLQIIMHLPHDHQRLGSRVYSNTCH